MTRPIPICQVSRFRRFMRWIVPFHRHLQVQTVPRRRARHWLNPFRPKLRGYKIDCGGFDCQSRKLVLRIRNNNAATVNIHSIHGMGTIPSKSLQSVMNFQLKFQDESPSGKLCKIASLGRSTIIIESQGRRPGKSRGSWLNGSSKNLGRALTAPSSKEEADHRQLVFASHRMEL